MSKNRDAVFPSRMALTQYKVKTKAAQQGFRLLKKKADALKAKQRMILKEIWDVKSRLPEDLKAAYFTLASITYQQANAGATILAKVQGSSKVSVLTDMENIGGVKIPKLRVDYSTQGEDTLIGLSKSGAPLKRCRDAFKGALILIIKLAGLQAAYSTLDVALRITSRRVNALENVVVPRLINTVNYINSELDERDREDLFRLKKVVKAKKDLQDQREKEIRAKMRAEGRADAQADEEKDNLLANKDAEYEVDDEF